MPIFNDCDCCGYGFDLSQAPELPDFPTIDTCNECGDGAPETWEFTIEGVTNGICSQCGTLNDTWSMDYLSACGWESEEFFWGCEAAFMQWSLTLGATEWALTLALASGTEITRWTIDRDDFDCLGENTLTGGFYVGCVDVPNAITISPSQ